MFYMIIKNREKVLLNLKSLLMDLSIKM